MTPTDEHKPARPDPTRAGHGAWAPPVFGAVADDDTGASDLAGMLAEGGLRTLLVIDLPAPERLRAWGEGCDAVVMAEGTRNLTPAAARRRTREALHVLAETLGPRVFQLKYCSTFDSTPEGNIGPSIDAALDELREEFTVALPALPVNGRTTYQGYHFVHRQLLSDSPMREHPLTPMTNPDLLDLLGRQTARRVGLAPFQDVEAGPEGLARRFRELREGGVGVAVVDCLHDGHVETVCRAAADLRLVTGSSAFGMKMPAVWRERGWVGERGRVREAAAAPDSATVPKALPPEALPPAGRACGRLVVAGSCSPATRAQNEWLAARGVPHLRLDPAGLLEGGPALAALAAAVRSHLSAGRDCLVTTTGAPEEVRRVQEWGAREGLDVPALGRTIADALAELVLTILQGQRAAGLVAAGGETSGALCRRLDLGALRVGRNVEPGVPLCFSLGRFRLPVVLKSGNFGGEDFYARALGAVARPAEYFD